MVVVVVIAIIVAVVAVVTTVTANVGVIAIKMAARLEAMQYWRRRH